MAKYRKVDPRIWNDAKFAGLSDHGKLAFLFIMTHPHMTAVGAMRAGMGGLAEELGWPKKAFAEAFAEGYEKGMFKHDERACFIGLPNFIKYNRPENPNVVTGWSKAWDLVPECDLKTELYHSLKAFTEQLGEAFGKAFAESFEAPLPNQEQEQEQEQEQKEKLHVPPGGGTGDEYTQDFEELWKARPKREGQDNKSKAFKAYKARLREGHTHEEMLAAIKAYRQELSAEGREGTKYVKLTATFLGPDKHFKDGFSAKSNAPSNMPASAGWAL